MSNQVTSKEKYIIGLTGKYAKRLLAQLEEYYEVEKLEPNVRKLILDSFNDLAREQEKLLCDK